ncbi:MAG TPA: 3' terminal RNA ribose 2'-O-methyltransferase Hen1 [Pyrinomonadaceae bacterium]
MLLTITNTTSPATDLGYLLHKSPFRLQSFPLSFGKAHVFYPEATNERCTAALLLDVDPVGLVRNRRGPSGEGGTLDQYVNDRPYVASSFLSVAISRVLGSALGGRSKDRPELVDVPLPLSAKLSVVSARGGEKFLRRLFEPLGYEVTVVRHELDEKFPEWGQGFCYTLELNGNVRLRDLLTHIYVLIPVLDNEKHYWVGDDEVEKLLRHGSGWLSTHPEKEEITKRYLKYRRDLAREALSRLVEEESPSADAAVVVHDNEEAVIERPLLLNEQRMNAVVATLKNCGAKRVVDLGCGEGKLLRSLLEDRAFDEIVGVDVSHRALEIAHERLKLDRLPARQRERLKLMQGSLTYRDKRLAGFDAATVIEVIEHLDESRLAAFERVLFEFARPAFVVLTTPNVEYNACFETLPAGKFRHKDHRFEWTREQFSNWVNHIAEQYGYEARTLPVGPEDAALGAPTQMAIFSSKN